MTKSIVAALVLAVVLGAGMREIAYAQQADERCLVGEVIFWAGDFVPTNWLPADGTTRRTLSFQDLFNVVGFNYGGNFTTSFGLPDLRGATPLGVGQAPSMANRPFGSSGGSETVTLESQHLPPHTHQALASGGVATTADPHGNVWAAQSRTPFFGPPFNPAPMNVAGITSTGGDQPHENMSPFLTLTPIICAAGVAPQPR